MKLEYASPATELFDFFKEMVRDFWKKQKGEFGQAFGYLEILNNYKEKRHFQGLIFQENDAPMHKSAIIGTSFFKKKGKKPSKAGI